MKKKLVLMVQVFVSVFILAYLFNSIFEREASEELKPLLTGQTIANLTPAQMQSLWSRCVVPGEPPQLDLKRLTLREAVDRLENRTARVVGRV